MTYVNVNKHDLISQLSQEVLFNTKQSIYR